MTNEQKQLLIEGVKAAGAKLKEYVGITTTQITAKPNSFDYSIPADKTAEQIILETISKLNLNCRIVSEESEVIGKGDSEYTIYVDPLDGSVNFSRGIPAFCIGIGVYKNNEPSLGIVFDMNTDELFVAEVGNGATVNGKKIVPTTIESKTLINLEWFGAPGYEQIVTKLKQAGIRARTSGSGVLALLYGCIGRGDGAILIANYPWDIAPGLVFAKTLGYEIKQFSGDSIDLSMTQQNVIAAPKAIFNKLIEIVNKS